MNNSAGGIGALAAADEERGVHIPAPNHADPEVALPDALAHLVLEAKAATEALGEAVADVTPRIDSHDQRLEAIEGALLQGQGQQNQVEQTLPQYANAINMLNARVNALGQQVARNLRLAALDAATKCRTAGEQSDRVLRNAEMFLAWLEKPVAEPQAELGTEGPEPGALSH